jgi:hypothetical protein
VIVKRSNVASFASLKKAYQVSFSTPVTFCEIVFQGKPPHTALLPLPERLNPATIVDLGRKAVHTERNIHGECDEWVFRQSLEYLKLFTNAGPRISPPMRYSTIYLRFWRIDPGHLVCHEKLLILTFVPSFISGGPLQTNNDVKLESKLMRLKRLQLSMFPTLCMAFLAFRSFEVRSPAIWRHSDSNPEQYELESPEFDQ